MTERNSYNAIFLSPKFKVQNNVYPMKVHDTERNKEIRRLMNKKEK